MGTGRPSEFVAGTPCTVNYTGDVYFDADCHDFLGKPCLIIKKTKAGLVMVRLRDNPHRTYTFKPKNITIT